MRNPCQHTCHSNQHLETNLYINLKSGFYSPITLMQFREGNTNKQQSSLNKYRYTVFPRISARALIVFVNQICPEIFLKNPENNILVGSNNSQLQYTYRSCQNQSNFISVCN